MADEIDDDIAVAIEITMCDAITDDDAIRQQIADYTWEIGMLTADYITTAQSFGQAQERELYWRDKRLLAQTEEEKAEANMMYANYFNLRLQLGAKLSRTLNRISLLFQLIQQLERRLQN